MASRLSSTCRTKNRGSALASKIPRWLTLTFLVAMYLLIAIGIYIGLHSLVLGPEY